jgi:putative ABC transport system permease protein
MKILPDREEDVLKLVESRYREFFPDNPFDYFFLEDYYSQQYKNEVLLGKVFGAFALLALIVTCLGIYGLTSFLVLQRTKEISMRRVAGAALSDIMILFSIDFIKITIVSFLLAVPLSYYWLSHWMRNFEIQMDVTFWDFVFPFIAALSLTLFTIGYIVNKIGTVNPAENLRSN